jgi:hypothetical protein
MLVHAKSKLLRKTLPSLACAGLLLLLGTGAAWAGGSISYSDTINWKGSSDLYFYVSGGPPNTCGDFHSVRNGSTLVATGYVCTDATGAKTMGPWTWSGTPSDQTDEHVYVQWPDGTRTNEISHIWDKLAPSAFADPFSGTPPTSWSGWATDPQWGAGFSSSWNSRVETYFKNVTTNRYWTPTAGAYTAAPICNAVQPIRCLPRWVAGNLYGMPSHSVTWDTSFPPSSAHSPGNTYEWKTCVYDNYYLGQSGCVSYTFSM